MESNSDKNFLNRFTNLPILLDILQNSRITLTNPNTWEDQNDVFYIEQYKAKKLLRTVLAYCLSAKRETFHHWKIYGGSSSGVCIEFDKSQLIGQLDVLINNGMPIRHKAVKYGWIDEGAPDSDEDWPFFKRKVYEDENEYRIIYQKADDESVAHPLPIRLECIRKITLSPWLVRASAEPIVKTIKKLVPNIEINHSTVLENEDWKKNIFGDNTASLITGTNLINSTGLQSALYEYNSKYRRKGLTPFEVSEPLDLYPSRPASPHFAARLNWTNPWPFDNRAGVYLIYEDSLELLYIGKASMSRFLGNRLWEYFGGGGECVVKHTWLQPARYVINIAVPQDMPFEAPALEEFLIKKLQPKANGNGK